MTDRHSNEDKGKRWRTNLTHSCTAKKAEDHQAVRFPEMTAQLDRWIGNWIGEGGRF